MKLIINAKKDDWRYAVRAVEVFLQNGATNSAIVVNAGLKFLITKNKTSLTVRGED